MKEKVIAVFDIGKTNKKLLLFNEALDVVYQHEESINPTIDEDGDECDDIDRIEKWIKGSISEVAKSENYELTALNFATYGASLVFLDEKGKRLTPMYNYLKEIQPGIQEELFTNYGGKDEFCRKTASPALGMLLNSGIQLHWLKQEHPDIFKQTKSILHFPQYLSFLFTGLVVSESTSIGCHTFLWDFDNQKYHDWVQDMDIQLPEPMPNKHAITVQIEGMDVQVGIGIHDSSASIAPYILGSRENFLLVSTGTWCINMNPFNHTPLTRDQLENDCLAYLSIDQNPVKSSRLFMGHIHDINVKHISKYFQVPDDQYKKVKTNEQLLAGYLAEGKKQTFFYDGIPANYVDEKVDLSRFTNFDEAYHRLMFDLTMLNCRSMDLISDENDGVKSIYISGGFARNEIFVRLLASFYPKKRVHTSEVDNATAQGAALVLYDAVAGERKPKINLGLKEWKPIQVSD